VGGEMAGGGGGLFYAVEWSRAEGRGGNQYWSLLL